MLLDRHLLSLHLNLWKDPSGQHEFHPRAGGRVVAQLPGGAVALFLPLTADAAQAAPAQLFPVSELSGSLSPRG